MRSVELSIIIVNYNTTHYLRDCLNSINKYLSEMNQEIIVVDNNSPNRDVENLKPEFPNVKFVFRKVNDGFGAGCNEAVKHSSGDFLLFVNPDVRFIDSSLELLIQNMKENEELGIVSGLLVDEKNCISYSYNEFPSLKWELLQLLGIGYEKQFKKFAEREEIKRNLKFEVDWFHGAFLLMRRTDFIKIEGFDECYFLYFEDVGLCFNMKRKLGKKNLCIPRVRVYHHKQSSIEQESTDNIFAFHMHRGKLIFIKNFSFCLRLLFHFTGMANVLSRFVFVPFRKRYKSLRKEKLIQLLKILKLYVNKSYLYSSKFEYVKY